jgi:hypothetical protein
VNDEGDFPVVPYSTMFCGCGWQTRSFRVDPKDATPAFNAAISWATATDAANDTCAEAPVEPRPDYEVY